MHAVINTEEAYFEIGRATNQRQIEYKYIASNYEKNDHTHIGLCGVYILQRTISYYRHTIVKNHYVLLF